MLRKVDVFNVDFGGGFQNLLLVLDLDLLLDLLLYTVHRF